MKLSRAKFESLIHDLVERSVEPCKKALADANVTPDMPDRFVAAYTKAGGRITLRKFEGEPHTFISQNPTKPASVEALGLITDFIRAQTR